MNSKWLVSILKPHFFTQNIPSSNPPQAHKVNEMTADKANKLSRLDELLAKSSNLHSKKESEVNTQGYDSEVFSQYKESYHEVPEICDQNKKLLEEMIDQINTELQE